MKFLVDRGRQVLGHHVAAFRGVLEPLIAAMLFLWGTAAVDAQLYLDVKATNDYYRFQEPLRIQNRGVLGSGRIGIRLFRTDDKKWMIAQELGFFRRRFSQTFPERAFEYHFNGFAFSTIGSRAVWKGLYADAGLSTVFYNSSIEGARLGGGFRSIDFGAVAGLHYVFVDGLAAGIRYNTFFIEMLRYRPIGDYGDRGPEVRDITSQRLEVYVRVILHDL